MKIQTRTPAKKDEQVDEKELKRWDYLKS